MRVPFSLTENTVPRLLVGFGVLLVLVLVAEWVFFARDLTAMLIGTALTLPLNGAIVFGGYWLARREYSLERCLRIAAWVVAGVVCFTLMNLALMVIVPPEGLWYAAGWLRWAITTSGAIALLIGIVEARAIEREVAAEQTVLEAEYVDAQRAWLDYLNALLRHEVLNNANVIGGYASVLLEDEDVSDSTRDQLRVIDRQSREMADVVRDVRILLESLEEPTPFEATNLSAVLTEEVEALRELPEDVRVDASIPESVFVRADDLLARLFSNLFANAVEHNDSPVPRVHVTVDAGPETVRVRIGDDGPGIPEGKLEGLFERDIAGNGDHGIGLYLVRRLVDRYDGTIEVTETGPEGTVFTVELPRVRAETERPSTEPPSESGSLEVTQ
ncbi:HAMP domain-containing histidine kinase [Halobacteria archaeon AArc-m2/3/4]|uniref:HAMP domain-containing histidine kinase n=1 Tax=Natronoglomus mannanivorans TaxID=2979990 RepID=A0ABT2QCL9_9EURY|nr:HAMP domain-containing histidine kinase [Halobacteria archaeon AArc-m2/3/4]